MIQLDGILKLFGQHRIAGKLGLIVATLLVPVVVLAYLLYANINDQIQFARGEISGADYFAVCRQSIAEAVEHRRLLAEYMTGVKPTRTLANQQQAKVEAALRQIEEIDKVLTEQTKQTHTKKAIEATQAAWKEVLVKLQNPKPQDTASCYDLLNAYDAFLSAQREIMTEAADGSKLTLDPEYGAYALMSVTQKMMQDADLLGRVQWRAMIAVTDKSKNLPNERKYELLRMFGTLDTAKADIDSGIEDILEERKNDIAPQIQPKLKVWAEKRDDFLECVNGEVIQPDAVAMTFKKLADESGEVLVATFDFFDAALPLLNNELKTRIASFRRTLYIGFTSITVGILLALGVIYVIARGFTRQIREYLTLFTAVDKGDYSQRVEKITSDELGEMTGSLNQVLTTTDELIKKQKTEYESLQRSILKLLEDVSGTAEGDLTRTAEVTADATGAIADSFNYMIEQLCKIIGNVQNATTQVASSTVQIQTTAEQLVSGSEHQAEQIVSTSAAIDEMAVSIQQVSENAKVAANIAKDAHSNAQKGNESVTNTIGGMARIRDQVQETAKRIKRLGESSQEIGQIIQLIDDIADRTSILALNASIQAAAAGEAGRGFAVVASEVERLAERSTEATKKIGALVKTIQSETHEAIGSMEKSIKEVVEGSNLANQAGRSLNEIQSVSQQLADLIHSISLAANQQARGSDALARAMGEIANITKQADSGTKQAAESVRDLAALADTLRSSVSAFRLPEEYQFGQPVSPSNVNSNAGHSGGRRSPNQAPALAGR